MFHQKLVIPQVVPYALLREEILNALNTAFGGVPVVLLIAPAGWGKTTTLATWARTQQDHAAVCWYTLDSHDRDPVVFFRYFLAALCPHCAALQPLLDQLSHNRQYSSLQSIIEQIVSTIAAHPQPIYIFLDDMHELEGDCADRTQPIFTLLSLLARYASPLRMVLTSRTTIPSLVTLRVRGHLQAFDLQMLAFSATDVIRLTNSRYSITLTLEQATALVTWAHGWPAAVVLALEEWYNRSASAQATAVELVPGAAIDHLYIFLIEQVFAPLPQSLQQFLIETAVLTDLIPQRCDALRKADDSARLLTEVQQRGLFVVSRAGWVSYHDLFRSFLLKLLWETPAHAQRLLRRAAELYQEWNEPEQAFHRWLELGDLNAASALVAAVGPKLRRQGKHVTVLDWLDKLRARTSLAPPLLLLHIRLAMDLADWNTAYASIQLALVSKTRDVVIEARLLEILIACIRKEPRASELMATIVLTALPPHLCSMGYEMAARVALQQGNTTEAIELLKQALASCNPEASAAEDSSRLAHLYGMIGMAMAVNKDRSTATYYLRCADAAWQASGDHGRRVITLNNLAMLVSEEGNLHDARIYLEEALHLAEQHGRRREQIMLLCGIADIALIEARFDSALAHYAVAADLANMQMSSEWAYACAGALRAAAMGGDRTACLHWQRVLDTISEDKVSVYAGPVALARALAAEDPDVAMQYLAEAQSSTFYASHDQAQLLLLQAQLAYLQHGWPAAEPHWQELERHVTGKHLDALLQVQCKAMSGLLTMAGKRHLAQRLRRSNGVEELDWEFRAFGSCAVTRQGQPCTASMSPIDQLVMIRLLEAGPVGLPSLTLWNDVWGEQPFSSDALRQSLSRIRRATELSIRLHQSHCQIKLPWNKVFYDVARFEMPLPNTSDVDGLKQRIALYAGTFLRHLRSETRWLAQRRLALHRRFLLLREALALAVEHDDPHNALQIYNDVLEEDGCREASAAGAMRCAARLGDRSLAILIYQQFCRQLLNDLGTDPSPAIVQIYQQIA